MLPTSYLALHPLQAGNLDSYYTIAAAMSIINSVLGSLSPKLRNSFEDPNSRDHELPFFNSPSSPPIPAPIASTVFWNTPNSSLSPPPRVPDELLALQRRARYLEQQLQELLDAQADGLMSGLTGDAPSTHGSTTPTVSSRHDDARFEENTKPRSKKDRKSTRLNSSHWE